MTEDTVCSVLVLLNFALFLMGEMVQVVFF